MHYQFADEASIRPRGRGDQDMLLVASVLHLMSHYSARTRNDEPCIKLASVIERHLAALSRMQGADPVLRATCEQLRDTWANLVDVKIPILARRNLFARLVRIDGSES